MNQKAILLLVCLSALALPAEAHPGHGGVYDFQAGFSHPWFGIDHLFAMIGVGLWASVLGGAARIGLPAGFLAAMALGALLAHAGIAFPYAESAVSASVLAVGVILFCGLRAALPWASTLAALFAFAHGYVHATEAVSGSLAVYYASGFLTATALLLAGGLLCGRFAGAGLKTAFGLVCAASGLALLAGV